MAAPHILVAARDTQDAARLCGRLAREGFVAEPASTPATLGAHLAARRFALVVLDLALPGVDTLSLARRLHDGDATPLITLSPGTDALDRVISLELGADDSLGTPLHPQELVARIRAVLRRAPPAARPTATRTTHFDGWTLQRHPRRLTAPDGATLGLSTAEFALLAAFADAPRQALDRDTLHAAVGGDAATRGGRAIDLLVSRLRRKLCAAGAEASLIRSVRGTGYAFEPAALRD